MLKCMCCTAQAVIHIMDDSCVILQMLKCMCRCMWQLQHGVFTPTVSWNCVSGDRQHGLHHSIPQLYYSGGCSVGDAMTGSSSQIPKHSFGRSHMQLRGLDLNLVTISNFRAWTSRYIFDFFNSWNLYSLQYIFRDKKNFCQVIFAMPFLDTVFVQKQFLPTCNLAIFHRSSRSSAAYQGLFLSLSGWLGMAGPW